MAEPIVSADGGEPSLCERVRAENAMAALSRGRYRSRAGDLLRCLRSDDALVRLCAEGMSAPDAIRLLRSYNAIDLAALRTLLLVELGLPALEVQALLTLAGCSHTELRQVVGR